MAKRAVTPFRTTKYSAGFTLIEVMLVVLVVGLMASLVQFSFGGESPETRLVKQGEKFQALFSLASEYALLNNVQLGLKVTEQDYQFLGFDGEQWQPIEQTQLTKVELPEPVVLTLQLDDLPLEQPSMLQTEDVQQAQKQQLDKIEQDQNKKQLLLPQVLLFASGDITPFSLTFSVQQNGTELSVKVTGLYNPELTLEGPFFNGRLANE